MPKDNLSVPLLRMARFFLDPAVFPRVRDSRDADERVRELQARGAVLGKGEERLLEQVVSRLRSLEASASPEDKLLRRSLARLAALVIAIAEDDDFSIPEGRQVAGPRAVDALAMQLLLEQQNRERRFRDAVQAHALAVSSAADAEALEPRLDGRDEDVARVIGRVVLHLRQGEELLARAADPARATAARARFGDACARATHLLARLVATDAARDLAIERANLIRRELARIEIDALGAERISKAEQARQARVRLAATEVDFGEAVTDANRARMADQLRQAAQEAAGAAAGGDDAYDSWLLSSTEDG